MKPYPHRRVRVDLPPLSPCSCQLRAAVMFARRRAGVSIYELNRRLGLPPKLLERFERGIALLNTDQLRTVADELSIDFAELTAGGPVTSVW